jgi:cobalt-zinc-cadmium efflux system membrane fusion protein
MYSYYYLCAAALLFAWASCTTHSKPTAEAKGFCLTDTLFANLRLDTAKLEIVRNELRLSGKVTPNDNQLVKVYPLVSGNLIDLKVSLGDRVTKGQVLAVVRSSEIAELENQLLATQSDLITAQKNLNVQEDLFRTGLTSEKEVVQAKNEVKKLENNLAKIKETQAIYGVGHSSLYHIKSPISGFVVERNPGITENMQFEKEDIGAFFTIANLDEVYIIANIYETDIARIREGYAVNVSFIAYPDRVFDGKIDKIFNVLDPETRVMKARIKLNNPDYLLKPEMFARINVLFDSPQQLPCVAANSVIFDRNRHFVIVYRERCQMEIRAITPLQTIGKRTYVAQGLKPDEQVLTKYQLLVYDALNN